MNNRRSTLFRWMKISLALYCLLGILFYYLQEKILFHPEPIAKEIPFKFDQPFKEFNLNFDENTQFNAVAFTVPDSSRKGIVLYFHGNRENINRYAPFAKKFIDQGWEVWMADYPGFGKSAGKLSEKILYEEALQLYKLARNQVAPSQIIIVGKSMGTGIAAELASVRDCRQLILESPYKSMLSLVDHYTWIFPLKAILKYQFPTDQYLQKVTAPVTIFMAAKTD